MSTVYAGPQTSSCAHIIHEHERRLEECLRALHAPGWEEGLQPLASHMSAQGVVRGPGYACPPVRHLDLEVLRETLSRLLRDRW
ncbi:MAG TPA: hypothetical protein VKF37_01785, partial [Chloroflexota bacterium]|nr:hypothetical protein [Chloroflexota bacterium]